MIALVQQVRESTKHPADAMIFRGSTICVSDVADMILHTRLLRYVEIGEPVNKAS